MIQVPPRNLIHVLGQNMNQLLVGNLAGPLCAEPDAQLACRRVICIFSVAEIGFKRFEVISAT